MLTKLTPKQTIISIPFLFLTGRLIMIMSLPLEGLIGYGDFIHFFNFASMGVPFIDYWIEFPPVFPFLSRLLVVASAGQLHIYTYLLVIILTLFQAGNLYLFLKIAYGFYPEESVQARGWIYMFFLLLTAYGWWYFDPLAVFFTLLGLYFVLEGRVVRAGLAVALGVLTKWFPLLLLPAVWRYRRVRQAIVATIVAGGVAVLVWGALYQASPLFTNSSLGSQIAKGSWETVWALIDGNLMTGNFGPEIERLDPLAAFRPRGNPAVIPSYLTLLVFGGIGGLFYWLAYRYADLGIPAFVGLTWTLFLLWSPGWSPQWVLYLLPLILLTMPLRRGVLFSITLLLVNFLEWPVLLSRGIFRGLWLTVPLRTFLLVFLALIWIGMIVRPTASAADGSNSRTIPERPVNLS